MSQELQEDHSPRMEEGHRSSAEVQAGSASAQDIPTSSQLHLKMYTFTWGTSKFKVFNKKKTTKNPNNVKMSNLTQSRHRALLIRVVPRPWEVHCRMVRFSRTRKTT